MEEAAAEAREAASVMSDQHGELSRVDDGTTYQGVSQLLNSIARDLDHMLHELGQSPPPSPTAIGATTNTTTTSISNDVHADDVVVNGSVAASGATESSHYRRAAASSSSFSSPASKQQQRSRRNSGDVLLEQFVQSLIDSLTLPGTPPDGRTPVLPPSTSVLPNSTLGCPPATTSTDVAATADSAAAATEKCGSGGNVVLVNGGGGKDNNCDDGNTQDHVITSNDNSNNNNTTATPNTQQQQDDNKQVPVNNVVVIENDDYEDQPCDINILERIIRTHPVWFLPGITRPGAVHLLQGKDPGNFIVRKSSKPNTMAISVRLPNDAGPYIEHYLIEAVGREYRLEGSDNNFEAIPTLVAHYCQCCDELPVQLALPWTILQASTRQNLSALAMLGQDFWVSFLAKSSLATTSSTSSSSGSPTSTTTTTTATTSQQQQGTTAILSTFGRHNKVPPTSPPPPPTDLPPPPPTPSKTSTVPTKSPPPAVPSKPIYHGSTSSLTLIPIPTTTTTGATSSATSSSLKSSVPPPPPPRWCKPGGTGVNASVAPGATTTFTVTATVTNTIKNADGERSRSSSLPSLHNNNTAATTNQASTMQQQKVQRRRKKNNNINGATTTHYTQSNVVPLDSPPDYYRSSLADKISDYEDIWGTPSKPESTVTTPELTTFKPNNGLFFNGTNGATKGLSNGGSSSPTKTKISPEKSSLISPLMMLFMQNQTDQEKAKLKENGSVNGSAAVNSGSAMVNNKDTASTPTNSLTRIKNKLGLTVVTGSSSSPDIKKHSSPFYAEPVDAIMDNNSSGANGGNKLPSGRSSRDYKSNNNNNGGRHNNNNNKNKFNNPKSFVISSSRLLNHRHSDPNIQWPPPPPPAKNSVPSDAVTVAATTGIVDDAATTTLTTVTPSSLSPTPTPTMLSSSLDNLPGSSSLLSLSSSSPNRHHHHHRHHVFSKQQRRLFVNSSSSSHFRSHSSLLCSGTNGGINGGTNGNGATTGFKVMIDSQTQTSLIVTPKSSSPPSPPSGPPPMQPMLKSTTTTTPNSSPARKLSGFQINPRRLQINLPKLLLGVATGQPHQKSFNDSSWPVDSSWEWLGNDDDDDDDESLLDDSDDPDNPGGGPTTVEGLIIKRDPKFPLLGATVQTSNAGRDSKQQQQQQQQKQQQPQQISTTFSFDDSCSLQYSDRITVEDLIQQKSPDLHVPEIQPLTKSNLLRVSEYDNLGGGSGSMTVDDNTKLVLSHVRDNSDTLEKDNPAYDPSETASSVTEFSEPWDSSRWDQLLQFVNESDVIQKEEEKTWTKENVKNKNQHVELLPLDVVNDAVLSDNKFSSVDDDVTSIASLPTVDIDDDSTYGTQSKMQQSMTPMGLHLLRNKNKDLGRSIKDYVLGLSQDNSSTFGKTIENFIQCTLDSHETSPHIVMRNVRQFMSGIKNYLVKHGEGQFEVVVQNERSKLKANEFLNLDAILEGVLHKIVIKPLKKHIYQLFVNEYTKNGALRLLSDNIKYARTKTPEEFGVKPEFKPPQGIAMDTVHHFLRRLQQVYSPLKKLENLLAATACIFNFVHADKKKDQATMGADDYLPMLMYILVHCGMIAAEIEADYMWGLLHPSLLTGEGGYYLTTLSSAVHVLKNFRKCHSEKHLTDFAETTEMLASLSDMQGFMKILIPDEVNGSIISKAFPVRPSMNTKEVVKMIAHKSNITNPQDFGLFKLVNGEETLLMDVECPHGIKAELQASGMDCAFAYKRLDAKMAWPITQKKY